MNLTVQAVVDGVRDILQSDTPISADTRLFSTGLLDSVAMMELIALIERLSGESISLDDVTLDNFDTATDIVKLVQKP
jgi:acyl carrier protein